MNLTENVGQTNPPMTIFNSSGNSIYQVLSNGQVIFTNTPLSNLQVPTSFVSFNNQRLTLLGSPTLATDAQNAGHLGLSTLSLTPICTTNQVYVMQANGTFICGSPAGSVSINGNQRASFVNVANTTQSNSFTGLHTSISNPEFPNNYFNVTANGGHVIPIISPSEFAYRIHTNSTGTYMENATGYVTSRSATVPESIIQTALTLPVGYPATQRICTYVEAGTYNLSTAFHGFIFHQNSCVYVDNGAKIRVPSGYTGNAINNTSTKYNEDGVFHTCAGALSNSKWCNSQNAIIWGGWWGEQQPASGKWTFLQLNSTGAVYFNDIGYQFVNGSQTVIKLEYDSLQEPINCPAAVGCGGGGINSNNIHDITAEGLVYGINFNIPHSKPTGTPAGNDGKGINWNNIHDITLEFASNNNLIIPTPNGKYNATLEICCQGNQLRNIQVWDLHGASVSPSSNGTGWYGSISANASQTTVIGGNLAGESNPSQTAAYQFHDNSTSSLILTTERVSLPVNATLGNGFWSSGSLGIGTQPLRMNNFDFKQYTQSAGLIGVEVLPRPATARSGLTLVPTGSPSGAPSFVSLFRNADVLATYQQMIIESDLHGLANVFGFTIATGSTAVRGEMAVSCGGSAQTICWTWDTQNNVGVKNGERLNFDYRMTPTLSKSMNDTWITKGNNTGWLFNTAGGLILNMTQHRIDTGSNGTNKVLFASNSIILRNPASTFAVTLSNGAQYGNTTLRLPILGVGSIIRNMTVNGVYNDFGSGNAKSTNDTFSQYGFVLRNPSDNFGVQILNPNNNGHNYTMSIPALSSNVTLATTGGVVTSITGTANNVTASASVGVVTLNLGSNVMTSNGQTQTRLNPVIFNSQTNLTGSVTKAPIILSTTASSAPTQLSIGAVWINGSRLGFVDANANTQIAITSNNGNQTVYHKLNFTGGLTSGGQTLAPINVHASGTPQVCRGGDVFEAGQVLKYCQNSGTAVPLVGTNINNSWLSGSTQTFAVGLTLSLTGDPAVGQGKFWNSATNQNVLKYSNATVIMSLAADKIKNNFTNTNTFSASTNRVSGNMIFNNASLILDNVPRTFGLTVTQSAQASNQTIHFPTILQTEYVAVRPVLNFTSPANQTGTASTTPVMLGANATFTPKVTGRVEVTVSGSESSGLINDGCRIAVYYFTTQTDGNGRPLTGTLAGTNQKFIAGVGGMISPFSKTVQVTGLTVNTKYYFDLSFAATGGSTCTITNLDWSVKEL